MSHPELKCIFAILSIVLDQTVCVYQFSWDSFEAVTVFAAFQALVLIASRVISDFLSPSKFMNTKRSIIKRSLW